MNYNSNLGARLPLARWLVAGIVALPFAFQTLVSNSMGVTSPRGGETVEVGDTVLVAWDLEEGQSAEKVVLWRASAGSWVVLTSTLGVNDSTWQWIPSDDDIGSVLRIGVSDSTGAVLALCRGYFSVRDSATAQKRVLRQPSVYPPAISIRTTPNPGTGAMLVEWGTPVTGTLQVVAMNGTVHRSYAVSEQEEYMLDPYEFVAGSYLVVLRPENRAPSTYRIVIQ